MVLGGGHTFHWFHGRTSTDSTHGRYQQATRYRYQVPYVAGTRYQVPPTIPAARGKVHVLDFTLVLTHGGMPVKKSACVCNIILVRNTMYNYALHDYIVLLLYYCTLLCPLTVQSFECLIYCSSTKKRFLLLNLMSLLQCSRT